MGVIATWKDTVKFLPFAAVFMVTFTVAAIYLTARTTIKVVTPQNLVFLKEKENGTDECNLFSGKWVYDDVSYPLYREGKCALMEEDFACERYGRKNLTYQNWRWQPHHCLLPKLLLLLFLHFYFFFFFFYYIYFYPLKNSRLVF